MHQYNIPSERAASFRVNEHSPQISTVQFTDPLVQAVESTQMYTIGGSKGPDQIVNKGSIMRHAANDGQAINFWPQNSLQ